MTDTEQLWQWLGWVIHELQLELPLARISPSPLPYTYHRAFMNGGLHGIRPDADAIAAVRQKARNEWLTVLHEVIGLELAFYAQDPQDAESKAVVCELDHLARLFPRPNAEVAG